jgi:hypothetical protein
MERLLVVLGAAVGGSVGWWLGAFVGTMTAFMGCMVLTGVGIYVGRRTAQRYSP